MQGKHIGAQGGEGRGDMAGLKTFKQGGEAKAKEEIREDVVSVKSNLGIYLPESSQPWNVTGRSLGEEIIPDSDDEDGPIDKIVPGCNATQVKNAKDTSPGASYAETLNMEDVLGLQGFAQPSAADSAEVNQESVSNMPVFQDHDAPPKCSEDKSLSEEELGRTTKRQKLAMCQSSSEASAIMTESDDDSIDSAEVVVFGRSAWPWEDEEEHNRALMSSAKLAIKSARGEKLHLV